MPIYEFKCKKCGSICEKYYKLGMIKPVISGELAPVCQECGDPTELIMSTSSYIMKGYNEKNGYS